MTDEERAWSLAHSLGLRLQDKWGAIGHIMADFAAIRAEQSEICAKLVEAEAVDEAATHCSDDYAYNDAIEHAAAAIRAMGDKGNG